MFHSAKTSASSSACRPEAVLQQLIGLADQLHVAVLDAVVDHLDVVAGAVFADPVAAGRAVFHLGGDGLEDLLHVRPRGGIAAGHDGRAEARAFLAAGDAGADEENALLGEVFGAAVGVGEERVAAVDDDVALLEMRHDLVDRLVDDVAGLDHEHDAARSLEHRAELRNGMRADDCGAFCLVGEEIVDLRDGSVEDRDLESVVVHVEHQVLAHDREADQSDIASSFWHSFVRSRKLYRIAAARCCASQGVGNARHD